MNSIAVIIPAFNAAPWIAEAIDSVLAQTRPASTVIVVDDGSTDATASVAERYSDAVMLIRQPNAGVSAARNHGAAQAKADGLLFLDADDRLRPNALETLVARAAQGNFGVVYGQTEDFGDSRNPHSIRGDAGMEGPRPAACQAAFWKAPISTPGAVMIRADLFSQAGRWNERFNTTADRDLWCRAGVLAEFAFAPTVVVERRLHGENMSGDKNRARRQAAEVQFQFLAWCAERGIDTAFLQTSERDILERNLRRALEERAFTAAAWIVAEAAQRSIAGELFRRAQRLASMPAFARELELKVRGLLGLR
jgi:glycosyltransferase involved in cell wall biosynthesis